MAVIALEVWMQDPGRGRHESSYRWSLINHMHSVDKVLEVKLQAPSSSALMRHLARCRIVNAFRAVESRLVEHPLAATLENM